MSVSSGESQDVDWKAQREWHQKGVQNPRSVLLPHPSAPCGISQRLSSSSPLPAEAAAPMTQSLWSPRSQLLILRGVGVTVASVWLVDTPLWAPIPGFPGDRGVPGRYSEFVPQRNSLSGNNGLSRSSELWVRVPVTRRETHSGPTVTAQTLLLPGTPPSA